MADALKKVAIIVAGIVIGVWVLSQLFEVRATVQIGTTTEQTP